jgi:hypothetical protein
LPKYGKPNRSFGDSVIRRSFLRENSMKKKILTGAMSCRNIAENKAGLNLKKGWLVRTGVRD